MISRGENVKAVQKQMRHATASMTLDIYSHLFPDDHAAAVNRSMSN